MKTNARWIQISLLMITIIISVDAHEGHAHKHPGPESKNPSIRQAGSEATKFIQVDYQHRIEPLFKKACMDCHGNQTSYPWYYKVPGIKQMIDADLEKAKHHLDFSKGYPFKSHASPAEDLEAIAKSIQEGTMPPFSYRLMHSQTTLSREEKKIILEWIEKSKVLLKELPF